MWYPHENNCNHGCHVYMNMVLSWSVLENNDLGITIGECFANAKDVDYVVFPILAEIA